MLQEQEQPGAPGLCCSRDQSVPRSVAVGNAGGRTNPPTLYHF